MYTRKHTGAFHCKATFPPASNKVLSKYSTFISVENSIPKEMETIAKYILMKFLVYPSKPRRRRTSVTVHSNPHNSRPTSGLFETSIEPNDYRIINRKYTNFTALRLVSQYRLRYQSCIYSESVIAHNQIAIIYNITLITQYA